jgi:hypothetical protein
VTNEEKRAQKIGERIVNALNDLEQFDGDTHLVLDAASRHALLHARKGTKDAVECLMNHYTGTEIKEALRDTTTS